MEAASTPNDGSIAIRGYHVAFRIERRIHKIDRWRLPVPYGVPMRAIAYAAGILVAVLILGTLPVLGEVLGLFGPWFHYAVLPVGAAWVLHRWTIDGRSSPQTAIAWLRWRLGKRRVSAGRAAPEPGPVTLGDVTVAPDGRGSRLRSAVIEGPAKLVFRYPVERQVRGRTLTVKQSSSEAQWRGTQVRLQSGQRVVVE
jgi:TcpE family